MIVALTPEQQITALSNLMGNCSDVPEKDKRRFTYALDSGGF